MVMPMLHEIRTIRRSRNRTILNVLSVKTGLICVPNIVFVFLIYKTFIKYFRTKVTINISELRIN